MDQGLMLKLATILDNPGEPKAQTQYRDPSVLKSLGYNGVVLFETTGLSGLVTEQAIDDHEIRRWVGQQYEQLQQTIDLTLAAGLQVYLSYDVLSLSRSFVSSHQAAVCCQGTQTTQTTQTTLCPASEQALLASVQALEALLDRFGQIRGVVLRFGDNSAGRLPYLVGNDIYQPMCSRCRTIKPADRIVNVAKMFYDSVVGRKQMQLILRAWNVKPDGLHDNADLCQLVHEQLPDDDQLMLSFKFTQTDFWRYQKWNQSSLVCGHRPIIYELECQREFEGKGALPNWQAGLWQSGCPEMGDCDTAGGLEQVKDQVNLAGVWAWVRGGGWGGPFVNNETWIDANVFAVPKLADMPGIALETLAGQWVSDRLHIQEGPAALALTKLLLHSAQTVLEGFYIGAYARRVDEPWYPNGRWLQDDLFDADALWQMVGDLPDDMLEDVLVEKRHAADQLGLDRKCVEQAITPNNRSRIEPLVHTLEYAQALLNTFGDLLGGLVDYRRYQQNPDEALAKRCCRQLTQAQLAWNHHTQRTGSLPGAASTFHEKGFWDLTQRILAQLM